MTSFCTDKYRKTTVLNHFVFFNDQSKMHTPRDKLLCLLKDGTFSDVTFVFGQDEKKINAHKNILSVSNQVFHSMFLESKEQNEFNVMDISSDTFKALLEFIYTDEYPELNLENWAPILYAAEKYQIHSLNELCQDFVDNNCRSLNACGFFNQARVHQVDALVPGIKRTIGINADRSLTSDSFFEIEDSESLKEILSSDELNCDEIFILRSALKWASSKIKDRGEDETGANLRKVLGPAIHSIRFPRINGNELKNEVIPKDVLTDEEIICILKGNKEDSNPFKCVSRIRSCERFNNEAHSALITSKRHSIQFQVDCSVQIYSFGICYPCKKDQVNPLTGRMLLKDGENAILGEEPFEIDYMKEFAISVHDFSNPIIVNSNAFYIAEMQYDVMNVETWMGKGGKTEITVDEVKWTFKNDPLSCKQTNVHQGQMPKFYFSKMDNYK